VHDELLTFNGVDGASGEYLLPSMSSQELASALAERDVLAEVKKWLQRFATGSLKILRRGGFFFADEPTVDHTDLAAVGWGAVFADDTHPAVKHALGELLDHRRRQAGEHYKELTCRAGERHRDFLGRHGVGYQTEYPRVPYYLLLVGDPESISYRFQQQLDIQYAVGRLSLERPEDYAAYARTAVEAETRLEDSAKKASFFAVCHDQATLLSTHHLVLPLAEKLAETSGWQFETVVGEGATKAALADRLGGEATPALLFSASHGVGFPSGHQRQLPHQGAVLCQDWSGPGGCSNGIPADQYCAGEDVASDARLAGLVHFHFGCFGAGTPQFDTFGQGKTRELAPWSFDARLPRRLLGHPRGGALAVLAHVDRSWGFSYLCRGVGRQLDTFERCLRRLMAGDPVGFAMEPFDKRYADLSGELSWKLEDLVRGHCDIHDDDLIDLWIATNDARSYVVLGDPAARLRVSQSNGPATHDIF
jgi:hypothetical protein